MSVRSSWGCHLRAVNPFWRAYARLMLSRAKHSSLAGHPKMALRLARLLRTYRYGEEEFFSSDGAPAEVVGRRRAALDQLHAHFEARAPKTLALSEELADSLSDLAFVNAHRVPFQYCVRCGSARSVTFFSNRRALTK